VTELLEPGPDIDRQDENGWTPLALSAAKGDAPSVSRLLEEGADVFKSGRDNRTPYMIALAAGHAEVARALREAMGRRKAEDGGIDRRQYCRAYPLKELREFAGWSENGLTPRGENEGAVKTEGGPQGLSDADIVFLHQDLSVTASMWHGSNIIFDQVTPAWTEFTSSRLKFSAPRLIDLLP
jgi:ankyrin repeat protein